MIPKFRAWDNYDNDMVTNIYFGWQDCGYESLNECLSDSRWSLMQSTSIEDSFGKEIYEGDVVKRASLMPGGSDMVGVVKMLEGCWVIDDGKQAVSLWTEVDENIVTGNIHEHSRLMEGK